MFKQEFFSYSLQLLAIDSLQAFWQILNLSIDFLVLFYVLLHKVGVSYH